MPIKVALMIEEWAGEMMGRSLRCRKAIGQKNLNISFDDKLSDQEKERSLRSAFRNFGKSFAEFIHFYRMSRNSYSKKGQHCRERELF